jgi:hypothetical protein
MSDELIDVATYSPDSIAIRGLLKIIFGLFFLIPAIFVIYLVFFAFGDGSDRFVMLFMVAPLLLFALHVPGGIGRLISASAKNCYLKAGPAGIAAQIPQYKLFGRFNISSYFVPWSDVTKIHDYTFRVNGIPTSHQLQIHLRNHKVLSLDSFLFAETIHDIQQRLLRIGTAPQRASSVLAAARER